MIGKIVSHYRILEELGRGGMGVVYKAEDIRLGRMVALKFLPEGLAKHPHALERFQREARAASSLNNPHICTIYEIDEDQGRPFIAMELLEGRALKQHIEGNPLPNEEIVDFGMQIADALDAAHYKGLVHRDIKPANIFVSPQRQLKVLDFGLAKLAPRRRAVATASGLSPTASTADVGVGLTDAGVAIGTAAYMSPEQARGEELDPRADIFALGLVLYEMATARPAFSGATSAVIFDAILNREPPALSRFNPRLPPKLIDIVLRAIEKDREVRYQTASDLRADLKRLRRDTDSVLGGSALSATALAARPRPRARGTASAPLRIAVLPPANVGGDEHTEYLSDGIGESLIDNLSRLPNLRVMSWSSVFRYKGAAIDPQLVGRELNVGAVLTGRIVPRGDLLAISVELVDPADNGHIWGERYNGRLSDILSLQEEIAEAITENLRLRLTGKEKKQLKRPTENHQAYQLYLKGRYHWNKRTEEGLKKGIAYFDQAIGEDPSYARAYAGLADCYAMLGWNSMQSPRDCLPKAQAAAMKAVGLDENLAEAHASLGIAKLCHDWAWAAAEKEFEIAAQLNPTYPVAHQWYAFELAALGRHEDALREAAEALRLDPLSLAINTSVGFIHYLLGRYEQAIECSQKALEMDVNFGQAHFVLGCVYCQMKLYGEAIAELQCAASLTQDNPAMLAYLGHTRALAGNTEGAEEVLEELKDRSRRTYVPPFNIGVIYAGLGRKDLALEWLEKAYEDRSIWLIFLKSFPVFDCMRSEPGFVDLMRRFSLAG